MKRVVVAVFLLVAVLAPSAHAAGLDETCELTATRFDADSVNVLFPDSSAQYWSASYRAVPGTHIRIDGVLPYARYMSWNVYDPLLRPFTHIYDAQLARDAGTTRNYTLYITFDRDFAPGPNTLYVDPAKNPTGVFTYRVYVPDKGRDMTGGVGLPQITWQPNSEGAPAFASPCRGLEKPTTSTVTDTYAQQDGPETGAPMPGRPTPVWHKFTNLCQAGADLFFDNPYGDNVPDSANPCSNFGSGGFLSNMDNAYLYTGISRGYGRLLVIHGRAPTHGISGAQLRYWSFCQNDPYTQRYIGCLRDDQVKLDRYGFYTIVVSRSSDRPKCAKNWIAWGPQPYGTLIYRHMLPAPDFSAAIQNATYGSEQQTMGDYYPSAHYSTAASAFCAKK